MDLRVRGAIKRRGVRGLAGMVAVVVAVVVAAVGLASPATAAALRAPVMSVGGESIQLENLNSNLCLSLSGAFANALADQSSCGNANQRWQTTTTTGTVPNGTVPNQPTSVALSNNLGCLTEFGRFNGDSVGLAPCYPSYDPSFATQQWVSYTDGTWQNVDSGLCMVVSNASTASGAAVIVWTCNGTRNSRWTTTPVPASGSRFVFSPVSSGGGRVLADSPTVNGAVVISSAQPVTWTMNAISGWPDAFQLVDARGSGYCLQADPPVSPLHVVACSIPTNNYETWFSRTVNADGTFTFHYYWDSSLCIDVYNNADYDNAVVGSWQCNGGDNQKFLAFSSN